MTSLVRAGVLGVRWPLLFLTKLLVFLHFSTKYVILWKCNIFFSGYSHWNCFWKRVDDLKKNTVPHLSSLQLKIAQCGTSRYKVNLASVFCKSLETRIDGILIVFGIICFGRETFILAPLFTHPSGKGSWTDWLYIIIIIFFRARDNLGRLI